MTKEVQGLENRAQSDIRQTKISSVPGSGNLKNDKLRLMKEASLKPLQSPGPM